MPVTDVMALVEGFRKYIDDLRAQEEDAARSIATIRHKRETMEAALAVLDGESTVAGDATAPPALTPPP
ncbi:MAG: hypothetical protein ACREMY_05435, partial [bacterium]